MFSLRPCRPTIRLAAFLLFAVALQPALAVAAPAACTDFMNSMTQSLPDQHVQFEHPLLVSRSAPSLGIEVYDLVTTGRVDGTLHCRRDHLVRFEAKISLPADQQIQRGFDKVQQAAMTAALNWPLARATSTLREMNNEADEYLRASIERGDVYLAGKTEAHENGTDLGMVWTKTDRTFIISRPE
ncbi:MAG TPA: hypothetical protein VG271_15655 [Beijerinckiaceae bacterium]|jgi:hypothetical protein|nr:hypothetical protein [Beijerinckiaceae bacterium]